MNRSEDPDGTKWNRENKTKIRDFIPLFTINPLKKVMVEIEIF